MDNLAFPSGLTVSRAKKRAKTLVKNGEVSKLALALDKIAIQEVGMSWKDAIARIYLKAVQEEQTKN